MFSLAKICPCLTSLLVAALSMAPASVLGQTDVADSKAAKSPQATETIDDTDLSAIVTEIAQQEKITGMVALVIVDHKIVGRAASGLRNANQTEISITINDKMHLGSCTKAITATLAGLLVDQGKLSWDDTIEVRLPQIADSIAEGYRKVTLSQLLQHRGGVIANGAAWKNGGVGTFENRLAIIAAALEQVPAGMEIGKFHYSNMGYAIIGAMIESAAGGEYEQLVQTMIFDPLEMTSAGFGPPKGEEPFDQPWGHSNQNGKLAPLKFDNPPSMSPAGRAHANLDDWAKFIAVQMPANAGDASGFLSKASLKFLHTPMKDNDPRPFEQPYAGGWVIVNGKFRFNGIASQRKQHTLVSYRDRPAQSGKCHSCRDQSPAGTFPKSQ